MSIVLTEDRGRVRHVVLNRAEKRNAMNAELLLAAKEALVQAAADPDVHVVVLRGEGPMFSSGVDLTELAAGAGGGGRSQLRHFRELFLDVPNTAERMTKPVICQIQGGCIGGALEVALGCDFRVASADALVGLPEVRLGLIPDVGGSSRLPALVGLGRAKELIMTGKLIPAEEGERIGLITRTAPADGLDDAVGALVDELLQCAPIAVGLAKRVMDASARPALSTTLEQEVTAQEICVASEDFAEAAQAFMAKRQPVFAGR
ncbi:enoyl-CoA hydratase/isomerase family protein [Conexibacter sp. SYSU D00693]|uniref:enoyl-CoA hydratase/isomerase family protein n=1 Tax=Conexibacter sp. SYSU D00693 TaxID=2812560 RepID=UPI00196A2E91|nr:enoyl-CoA hydratase/isomerase family protein [Conexibacter sp. SYSU D00693]